MVNSQDTSSSQGEEKRMDPGSAQTENANTVNEKSGDLFDAPPGSALIHACNAKGSWGSGIAQAFAQKYPEAYERYQEYCLEWRDKNEWHNIPDLHATDKAKTVSVRYPVGTALIIHSEAAWPTTKKPWVICLFTSFDYGRRVDPPKLILNNTSAALHDLREKLIAIEVKRELGFPAVEHLYSCRFNSGLFGVPWPKTRELLDKVALGLPLTIVYPPEPAKQGDQMTETVEGAATKKRSAKEGFEKLFNAKNGR
ncbi:hypothetical protein N7490_006422 [Penicillium lividum]|nr:hypothetical protein N7490_006422 [Penicillium lividum]